MDHITAIRKSLAAFVCGVIGALPVVGLIPALCALRHWRVVKSGYRGQWNPASAYLTAGAVLAAFGILNTTLLGAVVAIAISTG